MFAVTDHADLLRALYEKVSSSIDAQSVARHMFQCNALTPKELQSIQSKHSEPVKAAEELLNIVMNQSGNVYSLFLDALKKTDHQHVFEAILSDSCKGTRDRKYYGSWHFCTVLISNCLCFIQKLLL